MPSVLQKVVLQHVPQSLILSPKNILACCKKSFISYATVTRCIYHKAEATASKPYVFCPKF